MPTTNSDAMQNAAAIDAAILELRKSLGFQGTVDYNQALELTTTLDNMSDLLYYDVNRFIGRSNQYSSQYRTQTVNLSKQFRQAAATLHQAIVQNADKSQIQQQSRQLAQQWNDLEQNLANSRGTTERAGSYHTVHFTRHGQAAGDVRVVLDLRYR